VRRANQLRAGVPPPNLCLLPALLIAILWILFVGGVRLDEMIVGAGVIVLSAAFLYQVWRTESLKIDLKMQDLAQGWRIPWYIFVGTCEVVAIFFKDLFKVKRAGSFYRVSEFKTSETNPRLIARRVLAIFYSTMAPDLIVIGIDPRQNRMLVHQLKRRGLSKMTKALGARSGGQRS
jgi:hypothetical protein